MPVVGVHRLAEAVANVIGNVHDVVNGFQTNGFQKILQPFGRGLHRYAVHGQTAKARASLGIFDYQFNWKLVAFDAERRHRRHFERALQSGFEVAGGPEVRGRVGAVGREANFDDVIGGKAKIINSGCAVGQIGVQNHDAVVWCADANFVFGANHAFRQMAVGFARTNRKRLSTNGINRWTHRGHHHFLACPHVGRAANNLARGSFAYVHGGKAQLFFFDRKHVTSQHLANHNAHQTTRNGFSFLDGFYF